MSPLDAGLIGMESSTTPMHIGGIQVLKPPRGAGPHYVHRLYHKLLATPPSGAPFNYRYAPYRGTLGLPAWEEVEVVMEDHVFHHALPAPGSREQLMELVAELDHGLLDRSRPMWEYHLIEGLEGGRYATYTRIHHAMIDGAWGIKLMRATTSPDPKVRGLPPFWAVRFDAPRERGAASASAHRSWWRSKTSLKRLRDEVLKTGQELREAYVRTLESYRHPVDGGLAPIYSAPDCLLNGPLTSRRALAVVELDLSRIQKLAKAHEATINEVVLALCSGALRSYLVERDDLPDKPLIAQMPVALKRAEGQAGGNAVGTAFVALATHLADPAERFALIRDASHEAKSFIRELSPAALNIYAATTGVPFILAQVFGQAERVRAQNLVISNVPGAREKRYLNGAEIEAEYPMSLLVPGQAMNITVVSRADRLDTAVLVCPDLAPDPDAVARGLAVALGELEAALAQPRARKPATAKRTARKPAAPRSAAGKTAPRKTTARTAGQPRRAARKTP